MNDQLQLAEIQLTTTTDEIVQAPTDGSAKPPVESVAPQQHPFRSRLCIGEGAKHDKCGIIDGDTVVPADLVEQPARWVRAEQLPPLGEPLAKTELYEAGYYEPETGVSAVHALAEGIRSAVGEYVRSGSPVIYGFCVGGGRGCLALLLFGRDFFPRGSRPAF